MMVPLGGGVPWGYGVQGLWWKGGAGDNRRGGGCGRWGMSGEIGVRVNGEKALFGSG